MTVVYKNIQETLNFWKQQTHIMTFLKKHAKEAFNLEKTHLQQAKFKSSLKDSDPLETSILEYSKTRGGFLENFLSGRS